MLKQVNQLGQGALRFPEEKPETIICLGKKKITYFECGVCRGSYLLFLH